MKTTSVCFLVDSELYFHHYFIDFLDFPFFGSERLTNPISICKQKVCYYHHCSKFRKLCGYNERFFKKIISKIEILTKFNNYF